MDEKPNFITKEQRSATFKSPSLAKLDTFQEAKEEGLIAKFKSYFQKKKTVVSEQQACEVPEDEDFPPRQL
eukprot:CAMPEP_0202976090 /NCGR_PEP_ID=MMETSP1396-20130829/74287_1 /ASSEMBLY_ACC=CAM_ASM_000872 /TAXON_ID= /ORGANISM="Pseudokeronopsis sp., Strain Brazil" /LENGTH=70 /DNA_ID=CAMNT_0049712773 /DNA_START=124 /DNA_END=332 /DNA_ORIENTATION=+